MKTINRKLLSLSMALGLAALTTTALAGKPGFEKCYGIAKAGANDCGGNGHACAGQAPKSGDKGDWVYVPKGTCKKINGGMLKGEKK